MRASRDGATCVEARKGPQPALSTSGRNLLFVAAGGACSRASCHVTRRVPHGAPHVVAPQSGVRRLFWRRARQSAAAPQSATADGECSAGLLAAPGESTAGGAEQPGREGGASEPRCLAGAAHKRRVRAPACDVAVGRGHREAARKQRPPEVRARGCSSPGAVDTRTARQRPGVTDGQHEG